jgi:hypothetical protein
MKRNPALDAALALSRSPRLCELMARRPQPAGVDLVLRVLARDDGALDEAQWRSALARRVIDAWRRIDRETPRDIRTAPPPPLLRGRSK